MNIAGSISITAPVTVNEADPVADPINRSLARFVRIAYDDQPYNSIWTCATGTTTPPVVLYNVALSPTSRLPQDITNLLMWRSGLQAYLDVTTNRIQPQIYGYTPGWYYVRVLAGADVCDVNFVPAVFQGNVPPSIPSLLPLPAPSPAPRP